MNYTRVLHGFGCHPQPAVMPVDLALCLSLSQRQPLYQLLSLPPLKPPMDDSPKTGPPSPLRSSSSSSSSSSSPPSSPLPFRGCFRSNGGGGSPNKKQVVFADAKGLALTAVRLFTPEPSPPSPVLVITPSLAKPREPQSPTAKPKRRKLRLGFPQPTLDFKGFQARLQETRVQLESCSVTDYSFSGKVHVCHKSFHETVHVRVTFDSWWSHRDILCTYLQTQNYGGSDINVFSFYVTLPLTLDRVEQVEFFVSLKPGHGAAPLLDNNRGKNYSLVAEKEGSNSEQAGATGSYPAHSLQRSPSRPPHVPLSVRNYSELSSKKIVKQSRGRLENSILFHLNSPHKH
ncbi:protein phosphatase 1 regulatory subunit 3C-B [Genypterus blacodes]|uniref:protein phosphatase 1 regulatory subunit 3C-B n=1 Tax=Genypterus blacodes TaxID=154954 RepID=UPI003F76B54C